MLVQVRYCQQQKYVKLEEVDGRFEFMQFHEKEFSDCSLSSASDCSDSSFSSNASTSTILLDEGPRKKTRVEGTVDAASAKKLIEGVLGTNSGGEEVLQEYHTTQTLTDATRRKMVNIIVAHMIDCHGHLPTKAVREQYALGVVTLFPSLKDPYSKKGYEHFYDAASSTGYISWRLKTIQRKTRRGSAPPSSSTGFAQEGGGPNSQRPINVDMQLDGDACQEAISLLNHTSDTSLIFQKMRETFQHRQKLINDPDKSLDILSIFPRFLDTKGLVNQDFTLLFDDEISTRLLQKWDPIFRYQIIKEAKQLTSTVELRQLVQSAESLPGSDLDEAARGPKYQKISASDAVERLVVFHKSCCSLEEHLQNQQSQQPYLLAVGRQKRKADSFYVAIDKRLIPCQASRSLGAFDELFKAHFVFSVSYDAALVNFYTFLQTTVYNIDMGKMKESPRVRDLRAKILNQEILLTTQVKIIKMLTCVLCKRAYPSSQQLISHLRGEHGYYPGPKFKLFCWQPGCRLQFQTYAGFRKHLSSFHSNVDQNDRTSAIACFSNDTVSPALEDQFNSSNLPHSSPSVLPESSSSSVPVSIDSVLTRDSSKEMCASIVAKLQGSGLSNSLVSSLVGDLEELTSELRSEAKQAILSALPTKDSSISLINK
ncbi:unnamed protein product [Oreochromis niloticus]|nr:unnamed protein product [Mustela putorius furo]